MTILTGVQVFVNSQLQEADIALDEKIRAIGHNLSGEKIDCFGKVILPGLIDVHVHFRDLNQAHKEDWQSGGQAAVKGGVTTVFAMPNTNPPLTTVERIREYRRRAAASPVNGKVYGAITSDNVSQLPQLAEHVDAFKLYLGETTGHLIISDERLHAEIFKIIARTGKVLAVHAQRGSVAPEVITEHEAEDIDYALGLAARFGVKFHVTHVTTRRGVETILEAKRSQIDVTFETCPHYLFFTAGDRQKRGAWLKMNPPLATEEDQEYLWYALKEGLVDTIATDHAPHTIAEKSVGYEGAPNGVPGIEFTLPLLLDAVNKDRLSLARLVELCCVNPAKRFGLPKGELRVGCDADLVVVDMNKQKTITRADVLSKCGWSPYEGFSLQGWPVMTFVKGRLVYNGLSTKLTDHQTSCNSLK